jgi:hypothetical protein
MTVISSATLLLPAILDGTASLRRDFGWTLTGNLVYATCQLGMAIALAKLSAATAVGQFALGMAVTAPIFLFSNLNPRAILATDTGDEFPFRAYLRLRLPTTAGALGLALAFVLAGGYRRETAAVGMISGRRTAGPALKRFDQTQFSIRNCTRAFEANVRWFRASSFGGAQPVTALALPNSFTATARQDIGTGWVTVRRRA